MTLQSGLAKLTEKMPSVINSAISQYSFCT